VRSAAQVVKAIAREAAASARSSPAGSLVTIIMVIGMIVTVLLTTGRTVGAERAVLSVIDSVGTRSILVTAETEAGITADAMDRVQLIDGVEWAGAFSFAMDAMNTAVVGGARVPVRYAYGLHWDTLGIPERSALPGGVAYASSSALFQLGLPDVAGSITLTTGGEYAVAGRLETPDFLRELEPVVIVPRRVSSGDEPVNLLVIVAARPDLVTPVRKAVASVLAPRDPTKVRLDTSEALVQLRTLVQGQLGSFSRGVVLVVLAVTGVLLGSTLYGLVMMRRKDFGRRRALGATRGLIIALLLVQTVMLSVLGIVFGTVASLAVLIIGHDPLPGVDFIAAVAVLALFIANLAAVVPAVVASRRDPIRELRVP